MLSWSKLLFPHLTQEKTQAHQSWGSRPWDTARSVVWTQTRICVWLPCSLPSAQVFQCGQVAPRSGETDWTLRLEQLPSFPSKSEVGSLPHFDASCLLKVVEKLNNLNVSLKVQDNYFCSEINYKHAVIILLLSVFLNTWIQMPIPPPVLWLITCGCLTHGLLGKIAGAFALRFYGLGPLV